MKDNNDDRVAFVKHTTADDEGADKVSGLKSEDHWSRPPDFCPLQLPKAKECSKSADCTDVEQIANK